MELILNDDTIESLLKEAKIVPLEFGTIFSRKWKQKKGHLEFDYNIQRNDGSYFTIKLRQNKENRMDFSAILAYTPKEASKTYRLTRYNGKSHTHRNIIEKQDSFYDFHIHKATERYQLAGRKEEHFAEATNRYSDLKGAFRCLVADCNISLKQKSQTKLFDEN